jgi:hypothetical protein
LFNGFSKAAWELKTAVLQAPGAAKSVHRLPGAFGKAICSSLVALEQQSS